MYYYRIARLYQKLNYSKNDILDAFYKFLDLENTYNLYYFPMSNLQIALEYEKEENDEAALIYYQKTLKYDAFDYETGIKKSAKAGLNRIRNNYQMYNSEFINSTDLVYTNHNVVITLGLRY